MGKATRSTSKKAVRRSKREILLSGCCKTLQDRELAKQQEMSRILQAPKAAIATVDSSKRPTRRKGRLDGFEDGNEEEMESGPTHPSNVTQENSSRQKASPMCERWALKNGFSIRQCQLKRIAKKREQTDSIQKLEKSLGLISTASTLNKPDLDAMEISQSSKASSKTRKLAPGSEWIKFKRLTGSRRFSKRPLRKRYAMPLKGVIQHYPVMEESKTDQ